jgi:hypothetical protein
MPEMNRREFAETFALAALAPMLGAGFSPVGLVTPADGDPGAVAEALAAVIRAQYGDRLSDAELAAVTRQIATSLEHASKVRQVPLANGDEPDFVFSAVRAQGIG